MRCFLFLLLLHSTICAEFHIGTLCPVTSISQGYLAVIAAFDLDFRKNFEPDLQARLGPPVVAVPNLHPDLRVKVTLGTTDGDGSIAVDTLWEWMSSSSDSRMIGFVGALYSSISMPLASLAGVRKLPQISPASTNPFLSNKAQYPFFMRTVPPDSVQGAAMWLWMQDFNVPSVAFTYTDEPYGTGLFQVLFSLAADAGRASRIYGIPLPGHDLAAAFAACTQIREAGSKFLMMAMGDNGNYLMYAMEQEGLLYGSHQILAAEAVVILDSSPLRPSRGYPVGFQRLNPSAVGPVFQQFAGLWTKLTLEDMYSEAAAARFGLDSLLVPLANASAPAFTQQQLSDLEGLTSATPFGNFMFDTLYTFVFAINSLLNSGISPEDIHGDVLLEELRRTTFEGITGDISFDGQGDRQLEYHLWNAWPDDNITNTTTLHRIGTFVLGTLTLTTSARWAPHGDEGRSPPDVLFDCSDGFARDTTTNVCLPCSAGIGCGYRPEDGFPIGISIPITSVLQEFLAVVASVDFDIRKSFQPSIRERFGDPVIHIENIHPSLKLRFQVGTSDSQLSVGMNTALDWLQGTGDFSQVAGMVFGFFSSIAIPVASVATSLVTPMIGFGSTSPTLSDKRRYGYFLRTVGPDSNAGLAMWKWAVWFSIPSVTFLYSQEAYGEGLLQSTVSAAASYGQAAAVRGVGVPYFAGSSDLELIATSLQQTVASIEQLGIRFIMMAMLPDESPAALWAFEQAGLLYGSGSFQILSAETLTLEAVSFRPSRGLPQGFQVFLPQAEGARFARWMQDWHNLTTEDLYGTEARSRFMLDYMRVKLRDGSVQMLTEEAFRAPPASVYSALLFDAIYTYVIAINDLLNAGVEPADIHGPVLLQAVQQTTFDGVSGRVSFNENGDRLTRSQLFNVLVDGGPLTLAGFYDAETEELLPREDGASFELAWAGGHVGSAPPQSLLTRCKPGASLDASQGTCVACASGWFSEGGLNAECRLCPLGSTSGVAADSCELCPPGTYTELAGTNCTACPAGSFALNSGSLSCDLCAVGSFSDQAGASECTPCSGTEAQSSARRTTMQRLQVNGEIQYSYVEGAKSSSFCGCDRGHRNESEQCTPCGEGMSCPGLGVVTILPGYFVATPDSTSVYKCYGDDLRCVGGLPGTNCAAGRRGLTCSDCNDRMTPTSGGNCETCSNLDTVPFALLVLLLVCALCCVYWVTTGNRGKSQSLSLVLCATAAGQLISVVQQMAVVGMLSLNWDEPFKSYIELASVLVIDLKVLKLSCVGSLTALEMYTLKISMLLVAIATLCLIHAGVVVIFQKCKFWKHRWALVSALSVLLITFYITVSTVVLEPWQCKEHPNGKWTVWTYQSVVCWESDDHFAMLAIGCLAFILVPIGFLVTIVRIVMQFPRRMQMADTHFIRAFAFLFFRFRPGSQGYLVLHMAKSLLIACCLVLPDTVLQLFCLGTLVLAGYSTNLVFHPWRSHGANALDAGLNVVMLMVVVIASFFIEDEALDTGNLSWACLIVLNCGLACIPAAIIWGLYRRFIRIAKNYEFFLCHYKASSGAYTRLLKLHLLQAPRQRGDVFIDSDNLDNLDHLFEYIRSDTRTLVIVATAEIFMRVWCIGEMTTARISKVGSLLLAMPCCHLPDSDFLEKLESEGLPNLRVLTESGMDMTMVADTMIWVAQLPQIEVSATISHDGMRSTVDRIHRREEPSSSSLDGENRSLQARSLTSGVLSLALSYFLYDAADMEAASACHVLRMMLVPLMSNRIDLLPACLEEVEDFPEQKAELVLVMCTNGAFENPICVELLSMLQTSKQTRTHPVLTEATFRFPPQDVFSWLQKFNLPGLSDTTLERAASTVSVLFKEIATSFQPGHSSHLVLQVNAQEVCKRIAMHSVEAKSTMAATSSGGSGAKKAFESGGRTPTAEKTAVMAALQESIGSSPTSADFKSAPGHSPTSEHLKMEHQIPSIEISTTLDV